VPPPAQLSADEPPAVDMVLTAAEPEEQSIIDTAPLAPPSGAGADGFEAAFTGQNTLDDIERQAILATLRATGGDRTACARILGIDKSTLYRKLKRYNVALGADDPTDAM
jgi:transcriptional regulator of acetoin/glycerol metabolism